MSPVKRLFSRPGARADILIRDAYVLDPRTDLDGAHDVLIRGGEIAEIGAAGYAARARRGRHRRRGRQTPVPGVRRPARAPAHARSGVQGGHRLRHGRRGRGRVLRDRRDAQHHPDRRHRVGRQLADRRGVAAGPGADRLFGEHHPRPARRGTDRDGRPARRGGDRLHRRRQAGDLSRDACAARCSTSG